MAEGGWQYGVPTPPRLAIQDAPRCWGKSYDAADRECKGCGFQASCRDEIARKNAEPRPVTASYWAPPAPRTYASPVPVQPVSVQSYVPQMQMARAAPMQVAPAQPQMPAHRYGWLQDPMYQLIHSAPPPMRQQMPGESFVGRMAKNAALAMLEKGIGELFLAIRQMIFAPPAVTIDVTPTQVPPRNE